MADYEDTAESTVGGKKKVKRVCMFAQAIKHKNDGLSKALMCRWAGSGTDRHPAVKTGAECLLTSY